jgi:hypothetical protein
MEQGSGVAMSAYTQGVRYIEEACELARLHGATVEVDMKEKGAGRHPMIRVSFNGKSELITAALTSRYSLPALLGTMKRALRNIGALKDRGPGERRRRKRKQRDRVTLTAYRREPTPVQRTFRDQLRDWKFHNMRQVS